VCQLARHKASATRDWIPCYGDRVRRQGAKNPKEYLHSVFGSGADARAVAAPGRVNLIGEHIDYHNLPVLPVALDRRVALAFRRREDGLIRAASEPYGVREFRWTLPLERVAAGDWENYIRAAAQTVGAQWGAGRGIDAAIVSDVPPAAGLSSSSALLVAFTLALLLANDIHVSFEELMEVLPDGEQFVGTRGGGMDHAAALASRAGHASLIGFTPLSVRHIPVPEDWAFLAAHSLHTAEKSGSARDAYNLRRAGGTAARTRLGLTSYSEALPRAEELAARLEEGAERDAFLHTVTEARRVTASVEAMQHGDAAAFGKLLLGSHVSLRDRLHVSCAALDELVDAAMACGALGARLTGAGFGGFAVLLCRKSQRAEVRHRLVERFYAGCAGFDEHTHLIDVEPADGALIHSDPANAG